MLHVRTMIQKVIGLRIDLPDPKGGTNSIGLVSRKAFANDFKFIVREISLVEIELSSIKLHSQLSAILRIVNSEAFGNLCTDTYTVELG